MASRVYLESPYSGDIPRNVEYALHAMQDCLGRGEAPFASHLLYTQSPGKGYVSDTTTDPEEQGIGRDAAINAALRWGEVADKTVVYTDLGTSRGMQYGIDAARAAGRPVEFRSIPERVAKMDAAAAARKRKNPTRGDEEGYFTWLWYRLFPR